MHRSDVLPPLAVWFVLSIAAWAAVRFAIALPLVVEILIALNVSTFFLYGFDKFSASMRMRRVPENVLFAIAFLGGPVGAIVAMQLFRHKTRKVAFQFVLAVLILAELAIVYFIMRDKLGPIL